MQALLQCLSLVFAGKMGSRLNFRSRRRCPFAAPQGFDSPHFTAKQPGLPVVVMIVSVSHCLQIILAMVNRKH
jgi:hypothetical protein